MNVTEVEYLRIKIKELTDECIDVELLYLIRALLLKEDA